MKKAALASAGIHLGLIAGAFVFLNLEPAIDETAAESVSVDIISMDAVSANPTEEITEATETLVSAGAEVEAEEVPETAEVTEVAEAEPAKAAEAVEKEQPKEQPAEKPKKAEKPTEKKPEKKPPSKQASLGNGGKADADSAASKKSGGGQGKQNTGGAAAEDAYAGKVRAKVARSVKTPKGKFEGGEARIIVLIGANGQLLKSTMSRSSGDPKVDDAAAAAVKRAAPFPPIPEGLGQSSVSVTLPIQIDS